MTLEQIINAVSAALYGEFGDGYEIYQDKVEQGLEEPCFFIKSIMNSQSRVLGRIFDKSNLIVVQYFPETTESKETAGVMERLFECLQDIKIGDYYYHGTDMSSQVTDGVLSFTVSYDMRVIQSAQPETLMQNLELEQGGK